MVRRFLSIAATSCARSRLSKADGRTEPADGNGLGLAGRRCRLSTSLANLSPIGPNLC